MPKLMVSSSRIIISVLSSQIIINSVPCSEVQCVCVHVYMYVCVCVCMCVYAFRELTSMVNQKSVSLEYIYAFGVCIFVRVLKCVHIVWWASSQKVETSSPTLEYVPDFVSCFLWMVCGNSDGRWLLKCGIKSITNLTFFLLWITWWERSQLPCHEAELPYLASKNTGHSYIEFQINKGWWWWWFSISMSLAMLGTSLH